MSKKLRANLVTATIMLPGFLLGQLVCGSPNWALFIGLVLGCFAFAITDGINQ